jgi:hypothetical protein
MSLGCSGSPTPGPAAATRYCYSTWLRHLGKAGDRGVAPVPESLAELGPGDSLGLGLAAILSGTSTYLGFDVRAYADPEMNLRVLGELIDLFARREPIPAESEFPSVGPPPWTPTGFRTRCSPRSACGGLSTPRAGGREGAGRRWGDRIR